MGQERPLAQPVCAARLLAAAGVEQSYHFVEGADDATRGTHHLRSAHLSADCRCRSFADRSHLLCLPRPPHSHSRNSRPLPLFASFVFEW